VSVTVVGAADQVLEDRLRAAGMRPTTVAASELPTLAHPVSHPPDVLVLDLRARTQIPPILAAVKRQHPEMGLVVVTSALEPAVMLEAMRSGVTECVTDVDRGDLEAAISRLIAVRTSPVTGELFVFTGAKGGVGTTTAAVNTATVLSKIAPTLLIDLHLAGGDAALFLGVDSPFSVVDALENTHRLDAAFFRGLVVHTKAGPDLLASAERAVATPVDAARIRTLVDFATHHYRYTVLDVARSDAAALDALENATRIVLVANQELATVRSASRMATSLRQRYGKNAISVVLSRSDRESEIGLEDLQKAVGAKVEHIFPSDYRLALGALNRGQPLALDGRSALAGAFQAFGRSLAGLHEKGAEPPQKPGLLGRLTGRR
jgi:pilus assembly protein CpaE